MKALIACGIFLISLISGCASLNQQAIEFRISNGIAVEFNSGQFDTVDIQPSETQIWRGSELVGYVATMETNADFSTAVEEVRQGFREAQKSSGEVTKLVSAEGIFGFSVTINGYTTAFIATSQSPASWVTVSIMDRISADVLSTLKIY